MLPLSLLFLLLALAAAGCGSSSSGSSSEQTESSQSGGPAKASSEEIPPYNGPEKSLPTSYEEPEVKSGTKFVVGYLNPNGAVEGLQIEQQAIESEAAKYGGKTIAFDTQGDPQKQASDFKTLLTQGVTAIVLQPSDPLSLAPAVKEATSMGIPIVGVATPAEVGPPNLPGYTTDVLQGQDQCAYRNMALIAQAEPGGNFVVMGTVLPYPALEYLTARMQYWGKRLGLESLGEVKTKFADPKDGSEAMATILSRYPEVKNVPVWLDGVALGAATTARANGKTDIRILGSNGEKAAIEAVEAGELYATCKQDFAGIGEEAVKAAYNAQTGQNLPMPKKIVVPPASVTEGAAG
jgi:ribose transport system substrate-binding protein